MPTQAPFSQRIWLDHLAFAKSTLLQDADIPWLDATALAQWLAKAHSLLGQHVVLVPLHEGIKAWLLAHPDLLEDLRQIKGPMGLVRGLCAHPGFTAWLQAVAQNQGLALPRGQVVLMLPGPAALMSLLLHVVHGMECPNIDPEDAEDATVYLANALRAMPANAIDILAIDVRLNDGDIPAGIDTLYKLAAHYQWHFGVHAQCATSVSGLQLDFLIVDQAANASQAQPRPTGSVVTLEDAAKAVHTSSEINMDFLVVRLPDTALPEHVLPMVRALTEIK
jgi:hypothetical protein